MSDVRTIRAYCSECGAGGLVVTDTMIQTTTNPISIQEFGGGWDLVGGRLWVCPNCTGRTEEEPMTAEYAHHCVTGE